MIARDARWRWRLAFAACGITVLVLALRPAPAGADWFEQADKLRHALAFVVLWHVGRRGGYRSVPLALGLLLFGIGIECAQAFTPTREASAVDVLADIVGIALGAAWPVARPARPWCEPGHRSTGLARQPEEDRRHVGWQ